MGDAAETIGMPSSYWISKAELARLLGVGANQVDKFRQRFDHQHEKREGRRVLIDAPAWLAMWSEFRGGGAAQAEGEPDSPKRKLDKIKVQSAAIDLRAKRKQLIPAATVADIYETVARPLRQASKRILQLNPRCQQILDEALDLADEDLRTLCAAHVDARR